MKKKLIILTLILSMFTLIGCTQKKDTPTPNSTNNNTESSTTETQTTNPGADNATNNTNSMTSNTDSDANASTDNSNNTNGTTNNFNNSSNISTDSGITADKAKEIALTKVPGAALEHIVEFKSETDDNRPVYDGSIHYNGQEYDFEIDATTGDILEWDVENIK